MPDLVPEYGCELRFRVKVGEDAACYINVATRQGEGIHRRRVDNGKTVVQLRAVADPRYALADLVDVRCQLRVRID